MEVHMVFDIDKLNKKDRTAYENMTDSEKAKFEHTWILLESQKLRLLQYKRVSKERNNREKKLLAEKERKERTHRLVERGAILESYIRDPKDFSNDEIKTIVSSVMTQEAVVNYIEKIRARKQ